jgi:transcriptional regulator with XRE-family HTH domain
MVLYPAVKLEPALRNTAEGSPLSTKNPLPTDKHVGSRVRMRWLMLGMSQQKLADQPGVTFQRVQKYEKATNRIGASRLQQLCNILQAPISFVFENAPSLAGRDRGLAEASSLAYIDEFLGSSDGLALAGEFVKIDTSAFRRWVVRLVQGHCAVQN